MRPDTDTLWLVADIPEGKRLIQPCADAEVVVMFLRLLAPVVPPEAVWWVADKRAMVAYPSDWDAVEAILRGSPNGG